MRLTVYKCDRCGDIAVKTQEVIGEMIKGEFLFCGKCYNEWDKFWNWDSIRIFPPTTGSNIQYPNKME